MVSKKALSERDTINRTVGAIARGENRLLLVMATGTGKTYTAFQITYRLWKSKIKKRILYLADRNNLITQTKKGDLKHFKDKYHIIKQKKIDTSYEIYLALYQGLTNYDGFLAPYKVLRVGMNVDLEITGKSDTSIVRITGDDPVAKGYLENFINTEAPFPVIATTSKLMSTGTDAPALTRKERVENVRKRNYWAKYGENARRVLNALLDKYAETGIENIEEMQVLTIEPLKNLGTPAEIVKIFGGKEKYLAALKELENEIYAA